MAEPLAPETLLAHYRIRSPLGAGGMGEVYLAEDARLGRRVALKILPAEFTQHPERIARFEQEARAASALNHPNIITVFDIGQQKGLHFIAFEYVDGVTLRQRMTTNSPALLEALEIACQTAAALQAAHEAGITHRDIKPENVMLRPDGYVKVLDFGLAKLTEKSEEKIDRKAAAKIKAKTEPGMVMGTVRYMSPEQARGQHVDERSDIFSLGVLLYELITGRTPFEGATPSDVIAAILREEPPLLKRYAPHAPPELESSVTKALNKNREQRYQTIKNLSDDLRLVKKRLELNAAWASLSSSERATHSNDALILSEAPTIELKNVTAKKARVRKSRPPKNIASLAILPLANVSKDSQMEYLSDGITESIINSLVQLPKLRVVPASTVQRYKGRAVDAQQVGQELDVRAVLTGRVQQVGKALIVKTELIDVTNNAQLWGEQYRRQLTDIFALQDDISQEISAKLRLQLTGEEKRKLVKHYTDNTEAYHLSTLR